MLSIVEEVMSKAENQDQSKVTGSISEIIFGEKDYEQNGKSDRTQTRVMEISVLRNEKELSDVKDEWNHLLNKSEATVFQSYEWQQMWWKHFGNSNKLNILTFRVGEQLIGIAPFFYTETRLPGIYTYRHLQFMASYIPEGGTPGAFSKYSPSDYLDVIVDPDFEEEVTEALASYLKESRDFFDLISFNELPEDGVMMRRVIPKIQESNRIIKKEKREVCPRIELPETVHDFLYMLKGSVRYKLRRSKRPVTDDNLYEVRDTHNEQEFETDFNNLVELHQERWNKQGYPGAFADNRVESFLKEVSKAFLKRGWLRMKSAFDHKGNCIAVDMTFDFKKRIYDYQRAFDINSDLAKYRPGFALTYFLIEDAIEEHRKVFDMLRGDERYKLRLATSTPSNWKVEIKNSAGSTGKRNLIVQLVQQISDFRLRMLRELLIIRIHIREWGIFRFAPRYFDFLRDRIKG